MAIERIIPEPFDTPTIRFETFNPKACRMSYDAKNDIMRATMDESKPATSVDVGGEAWLRVDPRTGDVIGFEIEDFEAVFLKKRPEIDAIWREMKRAIKHESSQAARAILVSRIAGMLSNFQPQQVRFVPY